MTCHSLIPHCIVLLVLSCHAMSNNNVIAFSPPIARSRSSGLIRLSAIAPTATKLEASRSDVIRQGCMATTAVLFTNIAMESALAIPPQISYSTNAKNLDRLSAGDSSGGSVYDNHPSQPAARRRRAMQGCKAESARQEAASILGAKKLSEKECNMQVMSESPDFMLQALQKLECRTCPYGIKQ